MVKLFNKDLFFVCFSVCGGQYSERSGVIQSPGYPNNYLADKHCVYEIIQPLGTVITLTITDFDIETGSALWCPYDYLEVNHTIQNLIHERTWCH